MQDLLKRLDIENATIAQLRSTLNRINRSPEDYPEGEDLGPLAYEISQTMKTSAIATQSKGFTPVSTKSKAPQAKAITSAQPEAAPIVPSVVLIDGFEIDLSQQPDYDSWSDEHLDAYDAALRKKEERMKRRAANEAIQRSISQLAVTVNEDRAQSLELDSQSLEASVELKKQEVLLGIQRKEAPRLLALVATSAEEVAKDGIERTEKAIGLGKSLAMSTPVPAQVSAGRALQRNREMLNRVVHLDNTTAALLPLMKGEAHPEVFTLEAVAV
jgi:hypothetical protein